MKPRALGILLFGIAGGCTGGTTAGTASAVCSSIARTTTAPSPAWQGTVFTIVMENHSQGDILGSPDAPFINSLAAQNAVALGYRDNLVHPSEPNYIWMVAGENFGILDDANPISNHIDAKSHIADQLEMQGLSWKAYMESMGTPCGLDSKYPYEPKHDPFVYFNDINGWDGTAFQPSARCNAHVVDYSQLDKDLAANTVPKYAFITPNMINDMHDGSVKQGDNWLASEVPKILGSDAFNKGGVLFLTWDEGSNQTDDPPMIVISPNARQGMKSSATFNASSYLKTVQKIVGVESLPCDNTGDTVPAMDELFTVPLDPVQAQ
ncbi:MAG TPA: alkaline phosphatase family protein [Kofleriaceae bacterium]|nr:alkaline phosphatase family protein [Kofleriaceae bacterium]